MKDTARILSLYENTSKHSGYQMIPSRLADLDGFNQLKIKSRNEIERMTYFTKHVDFSRKSVLDIGGNTGYFSFEALEAGASSVHHFEGNTEHSQFVDELAEFLDVKKNVRTTNAYMTFENDLSDYHYDIVLLLNVLHHLGDDYGDQELSLNKAKEGIIQQLNSLRKNCEYLIFQLGFNWKGDRSTCLFDHGTKSELIDFIKSGIENHYSIENIGIAIKKEGKVVYQELDEQNIERDDTLGEFLNRPIFILKAK